MTAGDTASFEYDTINPSELVVTFVNSAGTERRQIPPTAILSPEEGRDETPPTTSITVIGDEARVSAIDNPGGSGVLHTLYTTDLLTFMTLTPPFSSFIPHDARLVMAFSVDRNGNREYPGAVLPVLGLSQTRFVFKATSGNQRVAPQILQIVNRDPVPLTGSLEWGVAGNTSSWLRFEPREGKTPGVVQLSVNSDGLQPGTYTGILTISSPSPGVVFAQQTVEVELLVEANPIPPVQ